MTAAVRALLAAGASFSDHVYDYRDHGGTAWAAEALGLALLLCEWVCGRGKVDPADLVRHLQPTVVDAAQAARDVMHAVLR